MEERTLVTHTLEHTHTHTHTCTHTGYSILLTNEADVKIADFGVSEHVANQMAAKHTLVGTPYWMAPEVVSGAEYNTAVGLPALLRSMARSPALVKPMLRICAINQPTNHPSNQPTNQHTL